MSRDNLRSDNKQKKTEAVEKSAQDNEESIMPKVEAAGGIVMEKEEQNTRKLNDKVLDLTSKVGELTSQIKQLASTNEALLSDNKTLQATIRSQKCTLESLATSMSKQKTTMESMLESFSNAKDELDAKRSMCDDLDQRCKMLEKKNNLLRSDLSKAQENKTVSFTANGLAKLHALIEKIPDFSDFIIKLSK